MEREKVYRIASLQTFLKIIGKVHEERMLTNTYGIKQLNVPLLSDL